MKNATENTATAPATPLLTITGRQWQYDEFTMPVGSENSGYHTYIGCMEVEFVETPEEQDKNNNTYTKSILMQLDQIVTAYSNRGEKQYRCKSFWFPAAGIETVTFYADKQVYTLNAWGREVMQEKLSAAEIAHIKRWAKGETDEPMKIG